jgi:hypothetical protein
MILQFPDLTMLRLALTSGVVPPGVSLAPATAAVDDQGQVWLQPSVAPSRAALNELRRLKVQTPRTSPVPLTEQLHSWLQLFPVQREAGRVVPPDQAPVLFDLPADQFSTVATEILRLGNDRQSFRYLEGHDGERVLLRVLGPPYYTLLRALDHDGAGAAPVAYVECAPRAWIQLGHTHPFAGKVKVPEGRVLLLRPPREWTFLPDAPFRDLYEVLEFVLPNSRSRWDEGEIAHKLKVPLRLVPGDPGEVDELWVLRDRPMEQLDELVANAGDELLHKLSFAVAEKEGRTLMVLRVRPSKGSPPVPVLDAVRFRTYQKLPNLFVPSGKRLHPPLSRHVIRRLLAEAPAVVTWLYPHDDGTFTPETLPDEAFRPLTDWIDYVLDHDRQALQTWVQAAQFDFEGFVCDEEPPKPKKPPSSPREKKGKRQSSDVNDGADDTQPFAPPAVEEAVEVPHVVEATPELSPPEPSALLRHLQKLEERFLAVDGPLDHSDRLALWPALGTANLDLQRGEDAALCWVNAIWAQEQPDPAWTWRWFTAELTRLEGSEAPTGQSWAAATARVGGALSESAAAALDRVLGLDEPGIGHVRALAAYVAWAAQQPTAPAAIGPRLGAIGHFLERNERTCLTTRASWLASLALARLARADVLGLARARDRLLLRLYENGLRPEQELASFLRFSGGSESERARHFRDWMIELTEAALRWVEMNCRDLPDSRHRTRAYAKLILAYGLARIGEEAKSLALLERGEADLGMRDTIHSWMLGAFSYRTRQALEGKPHTGALPGEQLAELEQMERSQHSIIDRLRQHSYILEPDKRINAYRSIAAQTELDHRLARLADVADGRLVIIEIEQLLKHPAAATLEQKPLILRAAMDAAPQAGGDFAMRLLPEVTALIDRLPPATDEVGLEDHATLLEKALFVAAHFGLMDHIQALVNRFRKLLHSQRGTGNVRGLDGLAAQSFRGLRKLGMRDQIESLLGELVEVVLDGQGLNSLGKFLNAVPELAKPAAPGSQSGDQSTKRYNSLVAFRVIVHVAGAWHYFGRHEQADPVLDAAERVLLEGHLLDLKQALSPQQTLLARALIGSALQGPADAARRRLTRLLERLRVYDSWVTSSYFKLSQLDVLESVVLGMVGDSQALGEDARRLLDEDEFLIRRRIHRDLRELMDRAET